MSDETAELFTLKGERLGYSTYQGSADVMSPGIYATLDEAWDNRRKVQAGQRNPWDVLRDCQHSGFEAWAYSHYGGGFHWPTRVCQHCRVVTGQLAPYGNEYGYTLPSAEQQAEDKAWLDARWPHDGLPPNVREDALS